jgi:hypothetical protein
MPNHLPYLSISHRHDMALPSTRLGVLSSRALDQLRDVRLRGKVSWYREIEMLTREQFAAMKEAEFRDQFLKPLLTAMGFKDVYLYHGQSGELGKDIVCWKEDAAGRRRNYAVVAKAIRLSGKAAVAPGTTGEISTQVNQAFNVPFLDKITGEEQYVHECWVVCNHVMTKEFINATRGALGRERNHNVTLVDGDKLWEWQEQHNSMQAIWNRLIEASRAIKPHPHYATEVAVTETEATITLKPRHPNAFVASPLEMKGAFIFGESSEDKESLEAVQRSFETGSPVTISQANIRSFQLPDAIRALIGGGDIPIRRISMEPIKSDKPLIVELELLCEDGERFLLPYIELYQVRGGTQETTFSNEAQPISFFVQVVVDITKKRANLQISSRKEVLNFHQASQVLKLASCLSKPYRARIVLVGTGITLFQLQELNPSQKPPHPDFVAFVEDIAAVQRKTKAPILFPDRSISEREDEIVNKLRCILHDGCIVGTWSPLSIEITSRDALVVLERFSDGQENSLFWEGTETTELFGVTIPLGPMIASCRSAILANESEVREAYERRSTDDELIEAHFISGSDNGVTIHYSNWLPVGEALRGHPPTKVADEP